MSKSNFLKWRTGGPTKTANKTTTIKKKLNKQKEEKDIYKSKENTQLKDNIVFDSQQYPSEKKLNKPFTKMVIYVNTSKV